MAAPRTRNGKTRACAAVTAVLAATGSAALLFTAGPAIAAAPAAGASRSVVVTGASPAELAKRIAAAGGKVTGQIDLIHGVTATLPAGASLPGLVVADDRAMHVSSVPAAVALTGNGTSKDVDESGRHAACHARTAGDRREGAGVTVAVVDTGVANSDDLAGRVIHVDASAAPGRSAGFRPLADGTATAPSWPV